MKARLKSIAIDTLIVTGAVAASLIAVAGTVLIIKIFLTVIKLTWNLW